MRELTAGERSLMTHVSMWGSDGYPITKLKRGWIWGTSEVNGPPVVFKTKREAVQSFERFHDVLIAAYGEEAQARAIAELQRP